MHIYDAKATQERLPYTQLVRALVEVLRFKQAGGAVAPPRLVLPLGAGGSLLIMPATDGTIAITKLVTVHPNNAQRDLPSVQGEVIVLDALNGSRLCQLDGQVVTAQRTAAVSLLAAQRLAPKPNGPMLIVGAGTQGHAHVEAFAEGLGVQELYVVSRTPEHAAKLVQHATERGLQAHAVANATDVLDRITLIVTATTSTSPVLPAQVHDDAFIAAVGAYQPTMAELPSALIHRAQLYVDTLEGAQHEAGDLIGANVDWSKVTPLEHILDRPRPTHGPVVFKSVGHALWDLAAARVALGMTLDH